MEQRLSTPRLFVGGLFITAGVLLLIERFGFLDLDLELWNLWTLVFPTFFVVNLIRRDWSGAVVFLFLSAVFVAPRFFPELTVRDMLEQWPIFLVLLGLSIVVRSFLPEPQNRSVSAKPRDRASEGNAIFGNRVLRPDDQSYRGGSAIGLLGALTLDLRDVELAPDGAVLEVVAFWGGIEIQVPEGMPVENRVIAFMGGAEDNSEPPKEVPADAPRLEVRGFVWMAGLDIKNPS